MLFVLRGAPQLFCAMSTKQRCLRKRSYRKSIVVFHVPIGSDEPSSGVIAAVLFNFAPAAERTAAMKVTLKRGVFRLVMASVVIIVSLPIAKSVEFHVLCIVFCIGWLLYWLIGGFFDME